MTYVHDLDVVFSEISDPVQEHRAAETDKQCSQPPPLASTAIFARATLIRWPSCSSIHIPPPPAPQQKLSLWCLSHFGGRLAGRLLISRGAARKFRDTFPDNRSRATRGFPYRPFVHTYLALI